MKRKKAKGPTCKHSAGRDYRPLFYLLPFAFFLVLGCADTKGPTTRELTAHEKQDQAMRDPFGYGPKPNGTSDIPHVSEGGIGDFDRQGFDRDLKKVLGGP